MEDQPASVAGLPSADRWAVIGAVVESHVLGVPSVAQVEEGA